MRRHLLIAVMAGWATVGAAAAHAVPILTQADAEERGHLLRSQKLEHDKQVPLMEVICQVSRRAQATPWDGDGTEPTAPARPGLARKPVISTARDESTSTGMRNMKKKWRNKTRSGRTEGVKPFETSAVRRFV
mgnify:CR=1 FL=1